MPTRLGVALGAESGVSGSLGGNERDWDTVCVRFSGDRSQNDISIRF